MKRNNFLIKTMLVLIISISIISCDSDNNSLDSKLDVSELDFSVTQNPSYDNEVYLESRTPQTVPFWDYEVGVSNKAKDTVLIPFAGVYAVEYSAFAQGGYTSDVVDVSISENDPVYFSDPKWNLLTNGPLGKTWKVVGVYVGPQSDYNSNWWQPDISGDDYYEDTAMFDLNQGFNYEVDDLEGNITTGNYVFEINHDYDPDDGIGPFDYLTIVGGELPVQDWGGDGISVTTHRIASLTENQMILGQGAEFIPERNTEDWSWFTIYESVD